MVRNLLLFFVLLFGFTAQAQLSVEITPADIHGTGDIDENDIEVHVDIKNTSDTTVNLMWRRRVVEKPEIWWTWVCDLNACYNWDIDVCPDNRLNTLRSGESMEFQIHAKAFGLQGFTQLEFDIYDNSDTNNILGVVYATVEASPSSATTDITATEAIRVYPNPTSDYFRVFQSENVASLEVYSVIGKRVLSCIANHEGQYDVSNLAEGIYLVRLLDRDHGVIKTVRLSKN